MRLTLVYAFYQDGLCACGKPIIVAHDEAQDGWYETKESTCYACKTTEQEKKEKAEPGSKTYVVLDPEGLRAKGQPTS